jgi:hypothetical protein
MIFRPRNTGPNGPNEGQKFTKDLAQNSGASHTNPLQ